MSHNNNKKTGDNNNHHHRHRSQVSDYREKIPPNQAQDQEVGVHYENEEIVDSEWEDFEKLLR